MKRAKQWTLITAGIFFLLGFALLGVPGIRFSAYLSMGIGGFCIVWCLLLYLSGKAGRILRRLFCAGLAAVVLVLVCFEAVIVTRGEEDHSELPVDAIIVLGAGVNGETPSLTLRTRIQAAAAYMELHPEVPVVLSGGQGSGECISEAECMRRELWTGNEDWNARYLLEERSTSTAENFRFSKAVLQAHGIDTERAVIGVVTNDFHIFRAKVIARREGLQMVGVGAELPWWWLTANYYVREAFALVKTLIFDEGELR